MSDILTGFNMQGNDPIDDRIVSKSNLETLEQYLNRVPVQKRYYGLTFFALDKNNELRKYTFQTSLIEPTIDDDEEEIERIDKELQEHVSNKAIHKTSEEIRSEIVDADIPDTIARVQWTLDQINTAVINLIGGASDEYNTLKRIQTKIEELRAKIYGDDGGEVLKTLEQALKFLNQYKDFIVDIPDNFVSKQDIVDNLTTDDPTKVLSAKQGKILSDTLTNYFESAMQSIRTETDRAINAENRIETKLDKEIDRSTKEDQRIDSKLDSEINRSTTEDDRLDKKIDAETTRATTVESNLNTKIETETDRAESEESRIETKLDNEIARSTNKDTEHDNRLTALEGDTHEQNTDLGTTNSTFQLKYNTGNKIKHESDAISVRNAADTDYVNFIAKNATFKGDLLVEGQSFVTEAETVEIKDNLLLLNKGEVGAGVTKGIAGLEIDRGTEPNYQIIFDESDNRFKAGEIGDIQCLALRDGDDSMTGGMFTSWDSTTKRLKTTNIIPSSSFLYFGDNKTVSLNYSPANDGSLTINTNNQYLAIFTGDNYTNFRSTRNKFQFIGDLYTTGTKYALTFKRSSDNSEVLYHADIVNNLTSGGTNKVLSAEQGKLLQNSITSIQGSYLPLSGGTMTGSINLPSTDPLKMIISGSVDSVLSYWPSNNAIEFGNNKRKIFLRTDNSNIIHYINGSSYSIYDAYNLPDPVTLSGNNTFTGNNTFQAGKFNVGPFRVTSSGSLLLDLNLQEESAWSRSIIFRTNNDNISSSRFGGFNSIDDTSIGFAYIGIGDVTYSTAQYKFYANSLKVPYKWSIDGPDGSAILWSQTSEIVNLGRAAGTTKIRSGNTDLIHTKGSTEYIIWDKSNLPTPATSTDLANYLPLTGGTLTGQLTIKQSADIKLRLQSTDADNYCIIQAINSQASQLGVFGYAGDKWAIGHNRTYYEIWDKYNLTDPVTYTTNAYNYATLKNKDGQYFTYIKAGTNGLLPHSKATLTSGGSGSLGASDQSFNAAYINNLHTNKVTFGDAGPYITGSTSATQFLNAEGGVQKIATGGLYVGPSYASDALNLVPASGIYSQGNIRTSGWLTFEDNEWTNTGWAYKDAKGSIKVLSVINEANNKPTSYGSVLQFNSRQGHWCTQIWCDQTNAAGVIGTLRFRTTKSYASTEWNPWTSLVTEFDLNSYLTKTEASTLYYPYNGRGYLSITSTGKPVMSNNQGYAVEDKDGNEREVLWMGTNNTLNLGNTSQYTLNKLDLRCTTLTHNGSSIATQNYVTNQLSNYLPLTGGTLSGNLTINTVGSTTLVINNNDTNGSETFMRVLRKGTASAAIGFRDSLGAYIYNYNSNKYLFIDNDGYARVGTTSGSTRLALITDIPTVSGYLPLTGGTLTGTLSINSGGSEPLIINNSASAGEAYVVTKTQGTTRGVMGWNSSLGMFLQDNRGYTFSVKADGVYFGASSSTLTKLPTSTDLSNYLPLTGGNLTGKLSIKSSGSNLLILDSSSSTESVIHFLRSSTTKGAVGYYDNIGAFIYNFPSNTYLFVKDDGKPYVGTKTNYKKILTETDITGYATQSWAAEKFPNKTGTGASGTWGISITGNAATATNATQLGGTAASSYVKANDNISRLTNDSGYTTQEWVNGQGFLTSDSLLDKFVPTTGGYIRNSDQVLLRLQRTGVSTGTSRTIEMYFDDSNTDGTSTTPRGSIGYNSEVGMFLYSAKSKKFLAMEYTGRPFYGTPENRYYLLGSNTEYHNLDGYQRIGDIMIQWGYFTVQGNSTRAVNFPVSFTNTVWSVTGSWDNTTTGSQENWGFTDYTSSGFTIINGDGSSRVFHYIAIGPFTRS